MRFQSGIAASMVIAALAWVPAAATAAIVEPGGSFTTDDQTFVEPGGDVVASDARTITLNFEVPSQYEPAGDQYTFDVEFTSEVRRDPVTQQLTFVYRFEKEDDARTFYREGGSFNVESFAGFDTDVTALGVWSGTRSADGASLDAESVGNGQGVLPYFVIATDATEFDSNGSLSASASDEFSVFDPAEQLTFAVGIGANWSLENTFQPIVDDGGGNGGGGNGGGGTPIPLPAGAWLGLVGLFGGGAFAKARCVLNLRS